MYDVYMYHMYVCMCVYPYIYIYIYIYIWGRLLRATLAPACERPSVPPAQRTSLSPPSGAGWRWHSSRPRYHINMVSITSRVANIRRVNRVRLHPPPCTPLCGHRPTRVRPAISAKYPPPGLALLVPGTDWALGFGLRSGWFAGWLQGRGAPSKRGPRESRWSPKKGGCGSDVVNRLGRANTST